MANVNSVQHAQQVLEQVRELAKVSAEKDATQKTPRIRIKTASGKATKSVVLQREVKHTQTVINRFYKQARDIAERKELSRQLDLKRKDDDEEDALIALLL